MLAGGQALARGMTFLGVSYLTRALGIEMFGVIGLATAVVACFLLVVDAGLDLIAMRVVSRREDSVDSVASRVILSRLGLAAVAAGLLGLAAPWIASSSIGLAVMLAYSLTFLSFAANLKWSFQALEQNGLVAIALVLSQAVYLCGILISVHGPDDVIKVPLVIFGSELTGAAFIFVQFRRQGFRIRLPRSYRLSWAMLRDAFPLAGTLAVRTIGINFDLLLLGLVDTPLAVGLYSAVSRIIFLIREFGALYYIPLFPQLSLAAKEATERFVTLGQAGIRHAAVIIFPVVIGVFLTGAELLAFVFSPEYASAANVLFLLLVAVAFTMLTGVYRYGLIAYNRQTTLFQIITAGAAFNIAMNLLLVPRYSLIGAAWSAVASEALIFVLSWLAVTRSVRLSPWRPICRPALAAAGMAIILWLIPTWPFLLRVAVAVVSYSTLVLFSGAVRTGELSGLWQRESPLVIDNAGDVNSKEGFH